ncbi:MAG TPA: DUF6364 family protein [Chloroflexota bacterium]|nr:DUF6364 family protein [Chloroflexota bacterium]
MAKQNLTIQLDKEIIRKARLLAVERSTSISRLVADQIERLVDGEERYQSARAAALEELHTGFHLGGGVLPERAELHER